MRGLKLVTQKGLAYINVASFTDAWIETYRRIYRRQVGIVASFTDAWIETQRPEKSADGRLSHLLQMRGLKPKYESTDPEFMKVASFTDAWIETVDQIRLS